MKAYLIDADILSYAQGLKLQETTLQARAQGTLDRDVLFLLEHTPVFTLGQRSTGNEFKKPLSTIQQSGIEVHSTSRGGNVTYHGPGQLVGYPILDLTQRQQTTASKQEYSQKLERVMQDVGRAYVPDLFCREDLHPETGKRYVGVWKKQQERLVKLGFVGVGIQPHQGRFFSTHGFALNICLKHPEHFDLIDPCGLTGVQVASLQDFCKNPIMLEEIKKKVAGVFGQVFGYKLEHISLEELKEKIKK